MTSEDKSNDLFSDIICHVHISKKELLLTQGRMPIFVKGCRYMFEFLQKGGYLDERKLRERFNL